MNGGRRVLWEVAGEGAVTRCVMVSCCSGAELQVVRAVRGGDEEIVLRELYPDHSTLYERARELETETAGNRKIGGLED